MWRNLDTRSRESLSEERELSKMTQWIKCFKCGVVFECTGNCGRNIRRTTRKNPHIFRKDSVSYCICLTCYIQQVHGFPSCFYLPKYEDERLLFEMLW